MHLIAVVLLTLGLSSQGHAAQSCEEWFSGLKLKTGTKACELNCAMAENDMSSFDCTARCQEICKPQKPTAPCKLDDFWLSRLKGKTEPFGPLTGNELRTVQNALSQIPKSFRPSNLKAIVRASGDGGIANALSAATSSHEYIILFPRAFSNLNKLPRIIAHELSHFLIEREWKEAFKKYKQVAGWNSVQGQNGYRPGDFVDSDGKFSPEEDFANNIEFYLFETNILEQNSPEIFKWIKKNLGVKLKLEKGCQNAK